MVRIVVAVLLAAVVVVKFACALPGSDDVNGKVYDFNVVVQPRSIFPDANAGAQGCVHAVSALTQLCSQRDFDTNTSFRSEMRHHLSTLLAQPWHSIGTSTKLVSIASKAMCCVLRSGNIENQYAATRVIAALGSASTSSRRAMCSVIAVECSREVELLVGMVQRTHNATTDDDLVSTLQALSALSVCLPQGVIMPALHVGLTHRSRAIRAAAASSVSHLLTDTQTTLALSGRSNDGLAVVRLNRLLTGELTDWGILLLLLKSAGDDPLCSAAITALRPFFDNFTKEYITASQSIIAQQQARDCRSLLKTGTDAAARRNKSTAALLAWAHTRSARWAAESCPDLPAFASVLFPCAMHGDVRAASIVDPCLEDHVSYLQCNAQSQGTTRLPPGEAALTCQPVEAAARRCDYAHDGLCSWDGSSAPPYSVIRKARTWSVPTLYHAHDLYFRVALELYGEWARGEVEFVMRFLPPGATFVDAGAHVGTISLAVARQLGPSSTVIAIEATRLFASLAQANAAAAGLAHMRVIHAALSNTTGCFMARVVRTYTTIQNMGGQQVMRCPEQVQRVCAVRNCAVHGETFFDGSDTYEWCAYLI